MATARLLVEKYVSALPATLTRNTLYFVRNGAGFDIYCTNESGTVVAYALNVAAAGSNAQLQYNNNGILAGAQQLSVHDGQLFLNDDSIPPAPIANKLGLFNNARNGVQTLSTVNSEGLITHGQSFIGFNSYDAVFAVAGVSTIIAQFTVSNSAGTAVSDPVKSTRLGQIPKVVYKSGSFVNTSCGLWYGRLTLSRGSEPRSGGFYVTIGFRQADVAYVENARTFAGLTTSSAAPPTQNPFTLVNAVGVANDPTKPNPNNLYFTINGVSENAFTVDTGLSIATADEFYIVEIYCPPNSNLIKVSLKAVISGLKASTVFDSSVIPETQFLANTLIIAPRVYRQTLQATEVRIGYGFIYTERFNQMEYVV